VTDHQDEALAPPSGKLRRIINLWVLLLVVWMFIGSSLDLDILVAGSLVSAALAYAFGSSGYVWNDIRWTPQAAYHFIAYTAVFAVELVRANINMLRYVYSPRIDIKPAVIKVKTRLKTPIGRLALVNSIALTPGSLVLAIEGDTIFIHWLDLPTTDPDEAKRLLVDPFERHLEVVFG
jgi:multicomponent Na+:H+ antiporter subunit E